MSQTNNNNKNNNNKQANNNKRYRKRRNKKKNNGWNKPTKPYQNMNVNTSGCCKDEYWKHHNNNNNKKKKVQIYKSPYQEAYFDSHCHLDWILFKSGYGLRDLPTFANLNFHGNFGGAITVACAADMIRPVSELINSTHLSAKNIYGSFGLHPHNAKEWNDDIKQQIVFALKTGKWSCNQTKQETDNTNDTWLCLCGHNNHSNHIFCAQCAWEPSKEYLHNVDLLNIVKNLTKDTEKKKENEANIEEKAVQNNKVVAVGECGLDFHYNRSPQYLQKKVFIEQIEISKQLNLPIIVHAREAEKDTIEIMQKYCPRNKRIHLHCFADSLKYGEIMLAAFPNLFIGFTGAITFRNANNNRNTARNIPLSRILLETDGPYMSPEPYRGKISHPGYIPLVAQQIARLHGISDVNKVLKQCRLNVTKMYGV